MLHKGTVQNLKGIEKEIYGLFIHDFTKQEYLEILRENKIPWAISGRL